MISLKKRIKTKAEFILGTKTIEDIEKTYDDLFKKFKSEKIDELEMAFVKSYKKSILTVTKFMGQDAKKMTVQEYMEAGEMIKRANKEIEEQARKKRK